MDEFMKEAISQARIGIGLKHGGPFGSVVVKDGKIIGWGHNMVLAKKDSTAHGEITAIRNACGNIGTYDLSGCVLYTTGEPCTMCLCACMWANIEKVYYGATIEDNAMIGFRDEAFDEMFGRDKIPEGYLEQVDRDEVLKLFEEYKSGKHEIY